MSLHGPHAPGEADGAAQGLLSPAVSLRPVPHPEPGDAVPGGG